MKWLVFLILFFWIYYQFFKTTEITYDATGIKTIVTQCDIKTICYLNIGKKCGNKGYSIINEMEKEKYIVLAKCN